MKTDIPARQVDRQKTKYRLIKVQRKDIKLIKKQIIFLLNFYIFIYDVQEQIFMPATKIRI